MKVLVVAYYFPPYPRVGGRRWAKFCKYLNRMGINITVIAGQFVGESSWDKDIEEYEKKIIRVPLTKVTLPHYKNKLPSTIIQKVLWKLSLWCDKIASKFKNGNYQDPSYPDVKRFEEAVTAEIMKGNYSHLIITGGPFAYLKMLLKKELKEVKLILDLRDHWYRNKNLSEMQIRKDLELESRIINQVDLIISTEKSVLNKYKGSIRKGHLPHCIDIDDKGNIPSSISENQIVYGGDFYEEEELLNNIDSFASKIKKSGIECDFYTPLYTVIKTNYKSESINFYPAIPLNDFLVKINSSIANIYINRKGEENFIRTKFFELINTKKPILYFGAQGDVSDFLEKHQLGYYIKEDNLSETVESILENIKTKKIPHSYDLSKHTFEHETKRLVKMLEELHED